MTNGDCAIETADITEKFLFFRSQNPNPMIDSCREQGRTRDNKCELTSVEWIFLSRSFSLYVWTNCGHGNKNTTYFVIEWHLNSKTEAYAIVVALSSGLIILVGCLLISVLAEMLCSFLLLICLWNASASLTLYLVIATIFSGKEI